MQDLYKKNEFGKIEKDSRAEYINILDINFNSNISSPHNSNTLEPSALLSTLKKLKRYICPVIVWYENEGIQCERKKLNMTFVEILWRARRSLIRKGRANLISEYLLRIVEEKIKNKFSLTS